MLATKTVHISGVEYEMRLLGAREGSRLMPEVLKIASSALKSLGTTDKLDERALASALAASLDALDEKIVDRFVAAFGKATTYADGERRPTLTDANFDLHFAGRYDAMGRWLAESIKFNYLDSFLGDTSLGELIERVRKAGASKSPSQTVSTGSSGES